MSDRSFRLAPSDIDLAFQREEFSLVFQPKVDLATSRMSGAEAFVRWQHPQYGLLPPGLFLDFIEAQGRMPELTGFVFTTAFAAAQTWANHGKDWVISINAAPGTVTATDFCQSLSELILRYNLKPQSIIIEIPERAVAQEPETICEALNAVRALGVQVALDGGGIVPVDLSLFNPMPFTSIKVGGPASIRLAQRLGLKGKGAIAARMRYAKQFNLEAVAVGAEDEPTMAGLADVGFTSAQGIWIQKPLSSSELLAWDGKWARGSISLDAVTRAPTYVPPNAQLAQPAHAPPPAPPLTTSPAESQHQSPKEADADGHKTNHHHAPDLTKEDMQRVIEAVRAKRAAAQQTTLHQKPAQFAEPEMPVLEVEGEGVEGNVENERVADASMAGHHQGFGLPPDGCPTGQGMVERGSP